MNIIIYGAGATGAKIYNELSSNCENMVIAFTDTNPALWEEERFGLPVIPPVDIKKFEYDKIIIATINWPDSIALKLHNNYGIPIKNIDTNFVSRPVENRNIFLGFFAEIVYDKCIEGSCAEGGVYQGDFSKYINRYFPDRNLYLFDTFKGFDKRDTQVEHAQGYSMAETGHYNPVTTVDAIKAILPYPEKAIIRKGWFPETLSGVNDKFVFVNLDFDLYKPTLSGLKYFYQNMVDGGVILVHDYFSPSFMGVKQAVDEFCKSRSIKFIPIGDYYSIAIMKNK